MEPILTYIKGQVVDIYEQFDASHDFDHILRVMKNAEDIARLMPKANLLVIRLAVLLHDIDDPKYQSSGSYIR